MKNLISVIIPHYNTPDSLLRLIKSIPIRDDIEVIVVDDNSDMPFARLQQDLETFPNVQLFKNDSGTKGAGASRNIALQKAVGNWILFADADDFFVENFYDKLVPYLDSDYDIVYFPPTSMDELTGKESTRHIVDVEHVSRYYKDPSLKNMTALKYGVCVPWSKLIRRGLFDEYSIKFDEIMVSNDIMCMTKCAYYSSSIAAANETIYCVTRGLQTLTTKRSEKNFDIRVDVLIRRYCFLRENLSKQEFKYTNIDRRALGILANVVIDNWGMRKFLDVLKLYRRNKIKFFDIGMLNPVILLHDVRMRLIQVIDRKKYR